MTYARRIPRPLIPELPATVIRFCLGVTAVALATGCASLRRTTDSSFEVLVIPVAAAAAARIAPISGPPRTAVSTAEIAANAVVDLVVRLDVVPRERPIQSIHVAREGAATRAALVTFGSAHDPAAVIRVFAADTAGRSVAADALAAAVQHAGLVVIAPIGLNPVDAAALLETCATFTASLRRSGIRNVAVLVPASDTAAYPTKALSSVADVLVLRTEPAVPPPVPGPLLTAEEIRRLVGLRGSEIGVRRLSLLIPTHGYVWRTGSIPRAITYADATALAESWRVPLVRDPGTSSLYARAPGEGEIWIADAESVLALLRSARAMGIRQFAFIVDAGEDPRLWDALARRPQTISSSR